MRFLANSTIEGNVTGIILVGPIIVMDVGGRTFGRNTIILAIAF
jgi:hypothetical protein